MKANYCEGTWIAVPLKRGGFALGVIARATKRGALLCYFFGPRREVLPSLEDARSLRPEEAVRVIRAGDLHLLEAKWPILGELSEWNRSEWPVPRFVRRDPLSKRAWRVELSEKDLLTVVRETSEPYDSSLEENSIYGAGAAEIMLDKHLR